jgi:uncharacterized protein (TIRG00374 family)
MPFQKHLRPLAIAATLAMVLYLLAVFAGDARQVGKTLAAVTWPQLALILGLSLLNYALRFLRWQSYVAALGHAVPWRRHIAYYLAGFAFTVTPGKAGEAVRSLYLKPHGMSYAESLAAFFVERLLDVLAIAVLAVGGAWLFPDYRAFVLLSCLGIGAFTWCIVRPGLPDRLQGWAGRTHGAGKLARTLRHLASLLQASARLLAPGKLYTGLAVGVLAWAAEGFALYLILRDMDAPLPVTAAMGIYAVSVLAGALSFLPGGLGSTEAVMGLLLALAGVGSNTAIAATLLCRFTTLWFAVLIGLLAMLGLGARKASDSPGT